MSSGLKTNEHTWPEILIRNFCFDLSTAYLWIQNIDDFNTVISDCWNDNQLYYIRICILKVNSASFSVTDIVHENLKMGSDGESDQASGTSSDEVQSPTGVCLRNRIHRRISMEVTVSDTPLCEEHWCL